RRDPGTARDRNRGGPNRRRGCWCLLHALPTANAPSTLHPPGHLTGWRAPDGDLGGARDNGFESGRRQHRVNRSQIRERGMHGGELYIELLRQLVENGV